MEPFDLIGNAAFQPPGLIKSIQPVEIAIAAGSNSNTATIASVNTGKTIILYNGQHSGDTSLNPAEDFIAATLTNSTTVTASTNTANAGSSRTVCATVIEFYDWAVSQVIYGTVTSSANTQADTTILSVDTSRSAVIYLGQTTDRTSYNVIRDSLILQLLDSTTVRANRGSFTGGDNVTVGFCVVEFASGILQSLQTAEVSIAGGNTSGTATISSVTPGNCLTVYGGWRQTVLGSDNKTLWPYGELTDATTLTATRNTAHATSVSNIRLTVIEFKPAWISRRAAGTATIASGVDTQDETIAAVSPNRTALSWLGQTTNTSSAGSDGPYAVIKLPSSTTVRAQRGGTPSTTVTASYEAVEFA